MTQFYVNITDSFVYFWNICLEVWRFCDSINITLGPLSFTLFELFISIIALFIIWEMIFRLVLAG